jgi:hypothetical protein
LGPEAGWGCLGGGETLTGLWKDGRGAVQANMEDTPGRGHCEGKSMEVGKLRKIWKACV